MKGPERRKAPRETDRYRETTSRASRIIDEARLIRLEIGSEEKPQREIRALKEIVKRQVARHPASRPSGPSDE